MAERLSHSVRYEGLPLVAQMVKESTCQGRRLGFIPWVRKIPGGGHGNPPQYSCLENPMDRGAWRAIAHGVAKSQTRRITKHIHEI